MRLFAILPLLLFAIAASAEEKHTIPNDLGLSWPWDLVYFDIDPANADSIRSATIQAHQRPVQIERTENGARAWFIASIGKEEMVDEKGKKQHKVPKSVEVTLAGEKSEPGISMRQSDGFRLIDNGVYQIRIRDYQGKLNQPTPLEELPHWLGGMRVGDSGPWDGRAWFDGNGKVTAITTEVINEGPVFIDLHITYSFETETDGTVAALPLELGKQAHNWEMNTPPREEISKKNHHYELKLRFTMGDPWIEVNERYHLPTDSAIKPWGIHQYWMQWGEGTDSPELPWFGANDRWAIDTATWVRWFLYDQFGGNTNQNWVEAKPRPDQKGRPFALLRPRWNQGGGGAQDFAITAGGAPPPSLDWILNKFLKNDIRNLGKKAGKDDTAAALKVEIDALLTTARNRGLPWKERFTAASAIAEKLGKSLKQPAKNYDNNHPGVAIIASFASKWVGPYPATIAAYALDGNRGRARFPMIDSERANMHYGQRSYALCVGPRSQMSNLNNMVRRHTDWTLLAQIHKYILKWERNPQLAGPNALITGEQLANLRKAYQANDGSLASDILQQESETYLALRKEHKDLKEQRDQAGRTRKNKKASPADREAANKLLNETKNDWKNIEKKVNSRDNSILGLIIENRGKSVKLIDANLWIQRRFQDDFLNPTSRTMRAVKDYSTADLFSSGKLIGGPWNAALGYISTDLDAWPGWHQGWTPGNPNFHTDKYMGAIFIGAALRDHPHSNEWLAFGYDNYQEDLKKVFLAPDGVGYECPGYAGYSMGIQLKLAKIFYNLGFGNAPVEIPEFAKSGRWHRHLMTPYDRRIERRHTAPIGDTHRWDAGLKLGFGKLALFFKEEDPAFASEMMGMWQMLVDQGLGKKDRLRGMLMDVDLSIKPTPLKDMEWGATNWYGFGSIMRTGIETDQETFLTFKAGPARGHAHNEELSYHFYSDTTPISLDYNCSYTPRGDHAGLHNSMTFGRSGSVRNNKTGAKVEAMEQIFSTGYVGAFASGKLADVVCAERVANSVSMSPVDPGDAEFGRGYPSRNIGPTVHRRWLAMIKHPSDSALTDYLVVRDETSTSAEQQVNIHLLARQLRSAENGRFDLEGQMDKDILVQVVEATDLKLEERSWNYYDSWMTSPGDDYVARPGESVNDWNARMKKLMADNKVDSLPLPGWKPKWQKPELSGDWFQQIRETNGLALAQPYGWNDSWMYGEHQIWLRLHSAPGTPVTWVLYPYKRGTATPTIEPLAGGTGVRITLGDEQEEIFLATDPADGVPGQVVIRRGNSEEVLVPAGQVGPLGKITRKPLAQAFVDEASGQPKN